LVRNFEEWLTTPTPFSEFNVNTMQRKWLFILGLFGSYVKKSLLMPFQTIIVAKQLTELDFDLVNGNMRLKQTNLISS